MTAVSMRLFGTLVLFGLSVAPVATRAAPLSIFEACLRTVNDYAWYLDHPGPNPSQRAQDFAALFTPDASLTWPDAAPELTNYKGRKAIAESYLENTAYSRHLYLTSNIRIMPKTDTAATGTSYLTFYMHAVGGSMQNEGAITGVLENRDDYQITDDGCRISSRTSILRMMSTDGVIQPPEPD